MVPKYPFQVRASYRVNSTNKLRDETHNYEILTAAHNYRDIAIRKPSCVRVQIVMVLDETTRGHEP